MKRRKENTETDDKKHLRIRGENHFLVWRNLLPQKHLRIRGENAVLYADGAFS